MTGDGGVLKRRLRPGAGEFPVDCPLTDTTVRIHYRARPAGGGAAAPWALDTRRRGGGGDADQGGDGAAPLEVDTGCGQLPEAVELCARLMVPGELAAAVAVPRYAYQVRRRLRELPGRAAPESRGLCGGRHEPCCGLETGAGSGRGAARAAAARRAAHVGNE
jgi:hypothetical protein